MKFRGTYGVVPVIALVLLTAVVGITAVVANESEAPPEPTPWADGEAEAAAHVANQQAYIDSLKIPMQELASLPRQELDVTLDQAPMDTFEAMFGVGEDTADAVVRGRVTRVLAIRHNRIEVEFEVSRVLAQKQGLSLGRGPLVLVEGVTFEGPPPVLLFNHRRAPLFPGEEGILLIRPFIRSEKTGQWIALMDRGTFSVADDRARALTIPSDRRLEEVRSPDDVETNAVIDWGEKYADYPVGSLTGEIQEAAKAAGWSVSN